MHSDADGHDAPVSFGYKIGWLTIRSTDPNAVMRALSLADPAEATWRAGIDAAYGDAYRIVLSRSRVFVSPPVNGWIFVVGQWTMGDGDDPGSIEQLITRLSKEFGEAQAFATYRVIEYHHWMRAKSGDLERSFAYLGESGQVLRDEGEPTSAELDIGWQRWPEDDEFPYEPGDSSTSEEARWRPNEEDVMTIAGHWSINPQTLGPDVSSTGTGILARAPSAESVKSAQTAHARRPWWRFWD
jgi:hypothetical protein